MKPISKGIAGLLGGITALVIMGLFYFGHHFLELPFLPFDIFDWMARVFPGLLINFVIDLIVTVVNTLKLGPTASTAKLVEQGIAIVQFLLFGIIIGIVLAYYGQRNPKRLVRYGTLSGAVLFALAMWVETVVGFSIAGTLADALWMAVLLIGGGYVLARMILGIATQPEDSTSSTLSRRQFLYLVGAGAFTVLVTAVGVVLLSEENKPTGKAQTTPEATFNPSQTSGPAASPSEEALSSRIQPAPGTRPELTKNSNFYRVDIDTLPPTVNGESWRLEVKGLVEKPLKLSLADIQARPAVSQVITLECISNPIGGDLISTAKFTGVPLKELLQEAGLKQGVQEIYITSVDGFYESVTKSDMMDERTLLVYQMNGQPLPPEHGFPLRIYIPNHYGMKQPKWIASLEAIDSNGPGYWVDRGWSAEAIVQTTSVIDAVDTSSVNPNTKAVPVGGIAYAGGRGISKVEIQVDNGPWEPAELRDPPLSPLTWVQWVYNWKANIGQHTVRVRAYDGTGKLQEATVHQPYPNGATGLDHKTTFYSP
jgi:DMSO/TMAO reductase YedYZ molybdopterin-dependent catalytic subunit